MKILVVDDTFEFRNLVKHVVQTITCLEPVLAENGLIALDRLGEQDFSLMITDWNMPHMNGKQLIEIVRLKYPKMKILAWSSVDFHADDIHENVVYCSKSDGIHTIQHITTELFKKAKITNTSMLIEPSL